MLVTVLFATHRPYFRLKAIQSQRVQLENMNSEFNNIHKKIGIINNSISSLKTDITSYKQVVDDQMQKLLGDTEAFYNRCVQLMRTKEEEYKNKYENMLQEVRFCQMIRDGMQEAYCSSGFLK